MRRAFLTALLAASVPAAAAPSAERLLAAFAAATGQAVPPAPPAPAAPPSTPAPPSSWKGKVRVEYGPAKTRDSVKWRRILRSTKILDAAAARLTRRLYLPADLVIDATECGEANAWYDPATRRITFCYDYLTDASRLLAKQAKNAREADRMTLGSALHTFYHESGHALIDILGLPAVGREEDAVDQFATLTLLRDDATEVAASVAAMEFLEGAKAQKHPAFWDEHSFDKVRYYDTLCLIYGKDPEKNKEMVSDEGLPEDRAGRCQDEYQKLDAAWDKLLAPYLKAK